MRIYGASLTPNKTNLIGLNDGSKFCLSPWCNPNTTNVFTELVDSNKTDAYRINSQDIYTLKSIVETQVVIMPQTMRDLGHSHVKCRIRVSYTGSAKFWFRNEYLGGSSLGLHSTTIKMFISEKRLKFRSAYDILSVYGIGYVRKSNFELIECLVENSNTEV